MPVFALDFDGVLCDDSDLIVDYIANNRGNYKTSNEDEQSRLLIGLRDHIGGAVHKLRMFPFANIVVSKLISRGDIVGIISSNRLSTIEIFLRNYSILGLSFIHADIDFYNKSEYIKNLSVQYNSSVYYIGDEVRDILAARESGAHSVALASGMGAIEDLMLMRPDYLFSDISSIPTIG